MTKLTWPQVSYNQFNIFIKSTPVAKKESRSSLAAKRSALVKTGSVAIGDSVCGGIVAYILVSGDTGYVAENSAVLCREVKPEYGNLLGYLGLSGDIRSGWNRHSSRDQSNAPISYNII
jgi:hypothetical protein